MDWNGDGENDRPEKGRRMRAVTSCRIVWSLIETILFLVNDQNLSWLGKRTNLARVAAWGCLLVMMTCEGF